MAVLFVTLAVTTIAVPNAAPQPGDLLTVTMAKIGNNNREQFFE